MKTGLITTKSYQNHNTGNGHPEKIDRVTAVIDNFKKKNNNNLIWQEPKKFDQSLLIKTHSKEYIEFVNNSFPKDGLSFLDGDTIVSPGSKDATRDAAGSIITAIDGVESKEYKNAFCAVRPPGHHAEKNKAMGFCIYNNVAVGANYLIEKYNYRKVAIIDFDVHHGNGTQDIFYENEKVLYISTHQYPYYPGSGTEQEKGKYNNIFNIPLEAGTTSEKYLTPPKVKNRRRTSSSGQTQLSGRQTRRLRGASRATTWIPHAAVQPRGFPTQLRQLAQQDEQAG